MALLLNVEECHYLKVVGKCIVLLYSVEIWIMKNIGSIYE